MFKYYILFPLTLLFGCATKYVIPTNRFITPESQGGILRGQFEIQKTAGHELKIDGTKSTANEGVVYSEISRVGYQLSTSIFETFDLIWSHVGTANSMVGGKFQILGASRSANGTGHKLSVAALIGANDYETDDESIEFDLAGKEYLLLYGFRITENILPYASVSYSEYDFNGKFKSGVFAGQEPSYRTKITSLNGGGEFSVDSFFAKAECSYQQIKTSHTEDKTSFLYGIAFGLNW